MSEDKDILTANEVAEALEISPDKVKEWAKNGDIPGAKIGKEWRFSKRKLVEWFEQHQSEE
ncbi:helix-turn-helix domain-containing protein [Caldalkalibacillus salinus]|uniref:helix-turn-helix domain-containing protein n=1 Tax=Caldalkalibacillus salinus TaxID=2803787 RepID=UPI0019211169|nr:helix-turn-helix domain-containing protein [Caldalkalibacillus salinus]